MEHHDCSSFLEELVALRRETWDCCLPNDQVSGALEYYQENSGFILPCSSTFGTPGQCQGQVLFNSAFNDDCCPFNEEGISMNEVEAAFKKYGSNYLSLPCQEDCISAIDDEELGLLCENIYNSENPKIGDIEVTPSSMDVPAFEVDACGERKNRVKRLAGQPSKNLMAERRRRKRLNDRLSMLRSVVPKISKMDRTSILGDTIDYMKELLEKINNLQEEVQAGSYQLNSTGNSKELKPTEVHVRNTPKFEVARSSTGTRIEICCAAKPNLLLSTVDTLEALGLEIQQCVISCFNDFGMQASCSEDLEQRAILSSEEIKQALFRNAGYGGRCI